MLRRFSKSWFPAAILGFGVVVALSSFFFFELPYPGSDVPLEIKQRAASNSAKCDWLLTRGAILAATGLGLALIQATLRIIFSLKRTDEPAEIIR